MEKFAVDLEKVLDEFEYNEEREENISTPSVKNSHLPHLGLGPLRQMPQVRPPAASYRRPSFEPINLAEADFAASPPKSSISHFSLENTDTRNDNKDLFSFANSRAQLNNRNYSDAVDSIVSTLNNEVNINKQIILESDSSSLSDIWQNASSSLQSDEKPDLLEYNSKNSHGDTNSQPISNQLPDVTSSIQNLSVHGVNNNSVDNTSTSLDLISSANGSLLTDSNVMNRSSEFSCEEKTSSTSEPENNLKKDDHQMNKDCNKLINAGSTSNSETVISEIVPVLNETDIKSNENSKSAKSQIVSNSNRPLDITNLQINEPIIFKEECEYEPNPCIEPPEVQLTTQLEDETNQIDVKVGPQSDIPIEVLDYKAPIGFNDDLVLSEGELEEYLKELEVLDEPLPYEDYGEEKSLSLPQGEQSCTNTNSVSQNFIQRCNKNEISDPNLNNEAQYKNIDSSNGNDVISPTPSCSPNRFSIKRNTTESSLGSIIYHENMPQSTEQTNTVKESPISNSSSCSIKTLKYKTETSNTIGLLKTSANEQNNSNGKESSGVCKVVDVVSSNPFKSNNEFETESELKHNTNEELKSKTPNPFNGDLSQGSEKFEAKSKSTNPFEDDADDSAITDEEYIAKEKSFQPKPLELPNPGENTTNPDEFDSFSAFSKESSSQDIASSTETVVCSKSSITDLKLSADNATENVVNIPETNLLEGNTTCENNMDIENSIFARSSSTECLPSCSGSYRESEDNSLNSVAKMIPIKKAIESPVAQNVDEAGVPAEEDRPLRPNSLELPKKITVDSTSSSTQATDTVSVETEGDLGSEERRLGKVPPFWIPDTDAMTCMQCQLKFNVIKRRHHCRACGQVLCYKCCGLKAQLEYMNFTEARVCQPCFTILQAVRASESSSPQSRRQPNPNNPMEYCSTIPPLQQVAGSLHHPPPSVMVPVGVLKREGRSKSDVTKQVMFSDGIRPGGDLTELDGSGEPRIPFRRSGRLTKRVGTPPGGMMSSSLRRVLDPTTHSFIPPESEAALPPVISRVQGEINYTDLESPVCLSQPVIKFALNRNLMVSVKRVMLDCCVNRECWCFSSEGLSCVGQDEIVFLLECLPEETLPPKDVFLLINYLYQEAAKGSTVSEFSFTPATSNNLLGSRDHGGFLYIRTSYQCTAQLPLPSPPYLVALLVNRWETPWARLFPIRLVLRLGAEFRYYPSPLVSVRNRPPLYTDIGHTIINILADFRKYSYTLPSVRGLVIHMEDRQTTINIPRNRYDQVVRALNNSNDSVLAFGANLSLVADSHLVCMQSTEDENTSYHTQAINIHNKPRKVTGASFVVFNGALKVPGLAGKSNIVEDGLMVQVPSETMAALRTALRDMRDYSIGCGPHAEETVVLQWTADDTNFNIGVKSCIDGKPLDGVPSIRVHNGTDYSGGVRIIRWTEVFILQCEDSAEHSSEPLDISRLSESIARATCLALVPLLDLLSAAGLSTLAVRTTIHPDNVGYEAGSNGEKLPPLYMKSLDDELIAVVHQAALSSQDSPAMLELVFRVMEQG